MGRGCSTNGAKTNTYRILMGKPEGKRSLGRRRRMSVSHIKNLKRDKMGWYGLDRSGSG
jgi:hypothetical protein